MLRPSPIHEHRFKLVKRSALAISVMEEISEPPVAAVEGSSAVSEFNAKTMRTTKPGLKRLLLTYTVLFSFLIGVPFLWKSVEIYRSPLPFRDIDTLSKEIELNPLRFPCHLQAIFVGFSSFDPLELRISLLNHIKKLNIDSQCGTYSSNFTMSVTTELDLRIRAVDFSSDGDDAIDEALQNAIPSGSVSGGKVYSVVVVNGVGAMEEARAVVGKYRHAWILGRRLEADAMVEIVVEIFVKVFVNGGREEGMIRGEFMPVGSDGRIVLSFNLLNANPGDWVYDWDFQTIDEIFLQPVIKALSPIANIRVESQVLYHTPKSSFSYWEDKWNSYIFSTKDLPFFVNSNEWHLDTSIAAGGRTKILQFVVYIPSADESPLLLQLPNGKISSTNSFISPMWGGVIVWNPHKYTKDSERTLLSSHSISLQDLEKIFEVFMGQFRQLFGLKSDGLYVGQSGTFTLLASEKGFTEWELDLLSRQHTCFNLHSSATTLGSLSRLVQSLPRMIIMDEIGKQVKFSLEAAKLAHGNASLGVYDASAVSSRQARSLAEDAFFHPSMMSVSYYSFEHCFAVYSPFFLPVAMHVVMAALKELRRYKQEKAKYMAWHLWQKQK